MSSQRPFSQRPFFLSTLFSSIRQQRPSHQQHKATTTTPAATSSPTSSTASPSTSAPRSIPSQQQSRSQGVLSPRGTAPVSPGRRRGSDSSSEGFREVRGGDKWYIGGRTAGGEERYFQLGVMKRVRSNDGFSIDKLSL